MSLKEAAAFLKEHDSFFIVSHVSPDEDTLGSALALRAGLIKLGKKAVVACEDRVPRSCHMLPDWESVLSSGELPQEGDAVVFTDIAAADRAGRYTAYTDKPDTLCIDHHGTNPAFSGRGFAETNYVEVCAATGELILLVLKELGVAPDPAIGKLLYTAIASDTGNFAYSSTTARTFELMAEVMRSGFDLTEANRELFRSVSLAKTRLEALALTKAEILLEGRAALCPVSLADMASCSASSEDGDGIVDALRDIDTVEIACYIREDSPEKVKASLRAKGSRKVSGLARKYGGGGHDQAAGCTLGMPLEKAAALMREEIIALLDT